MARLSRAATLSSVALIMFAAAGCEGINPPAVPRAKAITPIHLRPLGMGGARPKPPKAGEAPPWGVIE